MSDDAAEHGDCVRLCTEEKDLYVKKKSRPITHLTKTVQLFEHFANVPLSYVYIIFESHLNKTFQITLKQRFSWLFIFIYLYL